MQAPQPSALNRHRLELRQRPDGRFVEAATFHELLVSKRSLVREDHPAAGVRGLRDLENGMLFLIEEERIFSALGRSA